MSPRLGSTLDDLLRQDGALAVVEARAQKRALARQLEQIMRQQVTEVFVGSSNRSSALRLVPTRAASAAFVTRCRTP